MPKIEQHDTVNFDNINICRKLRRLGKLDRIRIDETEHRSGLNKHLFAYIEHSGSDVLSFIKNYLSNLQPYMIERALDQEYEKGVICVIDHLYRVSVYIKVDAKQFEEVIVSFHESNKRGIARTNKIPSNRKALNVPVFAEEEEGYSETSDKYAIKVFIQRGLKVFPVILLGKKYLDGVYVVSYWEIERFLIDACNTYIQDLYTSDLDLDFEQIDAFTALQQLSFTSYGRDTFSTISLLIDSYAIQPGIIKKEVADFALVTFSQNLRLSTEQKDELIYLLETKYAVTNMFGIRSLLDRVEDNLSLFYTSGEEIPVIDANSNKIEVVHGSKVFPE